ncbi:hypothetical protein CJ030_MR6G004337 [Morella rubra]|uniref:Uncharacterized protein n=1 Tax=Morella rubra TaxID=262757 RepID=A0A6A1VBC6_9ROSI|nr:hypothetical protein CJ030_MR6G004337 [Morella rubra]
MDVVCAELRTLRSEVNKGKSQKTASALNRENELSLNVSHLIAKLEQSLVDRLRMEAKLRISRLEADKLRRESQMKDKELTELTSTVAVEKSLREDTVRKSLGAFKRGDELCHLLRLIQEAVRGLKRSIRQLQHDL